ncbi:MAG TPA: ABC transporter permease, partial [Thermoanaerobaculia bacterium]|nr:ABC transporter permease [Thermoanaerobaculia bacterium]
MSLWRHVRGGISVLTRRAKADRDIADEVEHYFEEAAADLERSGLTAEEARRRARKELGSEARVREEVREFGWENAVAATLSDLRYAARRLRRSPGFTAVGALTLALGIGASAAIFSVVFPILFEPLAYPQPGRVVMVWESDGRYPSFGTFRGLAQRSRSFESLAAISGWQPALIGSVEPQRLQGQRVTAEYFRSLGVPPALGRDFAPSDDVPQAPRVVILSDALWRGRFAADPAILGRAVMLDDDAFTVIGVMPARLENVLEPRARLWTPLRYDPSLPADGREWGHHLRVVGRLKAGVGPERASSELSAFLPVLARLYARGYENSGGPPRAMAVTPLQTDLARTARPALLAILGAV